MVATVVVLLFANILSNWTNYGKQNVGKTQIPVPATKNRGSKVVSSNFEDKKVTVQRTRFM